MKRGKLGTALAGRNRDLFRDCSGIRRDRLARFIVVLAAILVGSTPGWADDDAFRRFAVHVDRTPKQLWPGYGIYLGDGLVITASHVAGDVSVTRPKVVVDGQVLPARAVKEGSLETVDLTLLSVVPQEIPAKLKGLRLTICTSPAQVGDPVIVAIPERTTETRIASAGPFPWWVRLRFGSLLEDVPGTGNSGSGVFDAGSGCLRGIISRRLTYRPVGYPETLVEKYFVPAETIREFMTHDE